MEANVIKLSCDPERNSVHAGRLRELATDFRVINVTNLTAKATDVIWITLNLVYPREKRLKEK